MIVGNPLTEIIRPALDTLPPNMNSPEAEVLLLAIGFQESGFNVRTQHNNGPAHGFWQFEKNGGVLGVLSHRSSAITANLICYDRDVLPVAKNVWDKLSTDDLLGAAFARLLLWTGAGALPKLGERDAAWQYYLDLWRPGKPHESRWEYSYGRAMQFLAVSAIW